MAYEVVFPSQRVERLFQRLLEKTPTDYQSALVRAIRSLRVSFLVPYEDMLDLLDMLEELKDAKLLQEIARARSEYASGKAVPAGRLFKKLGL